MRLVILASLVAVTLSGCSGKSQQQGQDSVAQSITNAEDVLRTLKAAGLPVDNVRAVSDATDSNHLLGRPGQYTSKVFFYDRRHPQSKEGGDEGENTIEVFATAEDAKTRHDYIEGVTKGVPMLLQYQLLQGRMLARFDKVLLPGEIEAYKAALANISID